MKLTESHVEEATIGLFQELGYAYCAGPETAPDGMFAERESYSEVVLRGRLRQALGRINPAIPDDALDDAVRQVTRPATPSLILNNRAFHRMVTDGVDVRYRNAEGRDVSDKVWLFDFNDPDQNDWLVVNQFTVVENHVQRRADVVVCVNGLPLGVMELKNAADAKATVRGAYNQLQTYKAQVPSLFTYNEALVVSDGIEALLGTVTAPWERFSPWRTIDGADLYDPFRQPSPQPAGHPSPTGRGAGGEGGGDPVGLEVLVRGVFDRRRFLDLIRFFVTFEDKGGDIAKKIAAYHQYHAVNVAVEQTLRATGVIPSAPALLPGGEGSAHYRGGMRFAGLVAQARELRKAATSAEDMLWQLLRNRQLEGAKFRRQHQIGPYIADFFCAEAKLVVECDGGIHDAPNARVHDHKRDAYLRCLGNTVLRFPNERVLDEIELVLHDISAHLPSPAGRGTEGEGHADSRSRVGDTRIGVIWHTQGSGKSLTMLFYAGRIIEEPAMANPTVVVLTDRNDLDNQLADTFALGIDRLRQTPVQAKNRDHLQELLAVASGGVIFTTIQKFFPEAGADYPMLSDRRNIVVIADEAHRSQYEFIKGFARHIRDALPHASFIGFTGTPVELSDRSTTAVFGDHISVYDIEQAIEDGVTVPIYYEGRLAKIDLDEQERPRIDPEFDEITETEEAIERGRLAQKWSRLEAMVGTGKRLALVAKDIVEHFEQRQGAIEGKAMVVCMSRRICVDLYDEIVKLRPDWDDQDFNRGQIKVVMTGSASDPEHYRKHLMTGQSRKLVEKRFKKPDDPLKIVIVRDMWLTGFDVPCLHTMYIDKPVKGHTLMQTIARVNRVFRDKPGGLIVDYLGIAEELREAVATYTSRGGRGKPTFPQEEAVAVLLEKYEILCGIFHGFDWSGYITGETGKRLSVLKGAVQHVLGVEQGAERVIAVGRQLQEAFALSVPHPEAMRIKDDVGFFQAVRAQLIKLREGPGGSTQRAIEAAIKQLVSKSVASDRVVDIFAEAGLDKPDIAILDDKFLLHFQNMPEKNLAVEMLKRLLKTEIQTRSRSNLVLSRSFAEMLEKTLIKYQNRTVEAAQIIAELVAMAQEFRQALKRGEALGLNEAETAFYDALGTNDSAVQELGDDALKKIAQELVSGIRNSVTIDWTVKESVRARMRTMVKRILRKYDYPPDKQEQATTLVLEQAEVLCRDWAA